MLGGWDCLCLMPSVRSQALSHVQVAPCGSHGMQLLRQPGLQSLIQQAQAASQPASRLASHAKDNRASPAPSCPTPISQRSTGKQAYEGSQRSQVPPKDMAPKQAASAPLLLAPATEPEHPPLLRGMLLVPELRTNSAFGSTGAAVLPARSDQGVQQESDNKAGAASAQDASGHPGTSSNCEACSGSLATRSAGEAGALHAELQPPIEPSLYSLEQLQGGLKQTPAASKQLASSGHSPGSRSRAGRTRRLSAAQALFPEIQSRLPPLGFAMAGYTDMYDFPEAALAVADSFLRDAPSLERPEGPAMPAANQAGMQRAAAHDVGAHPAAPLPRGRGPSASAAARDSKPGATGVSTPGALAEAGTAADALLPEGPHMPGTAAGRPAAVAQETEQRSCRSSVTPHKTGARDMHGEEDSLRPQQQRERHQRGTQSRAEQPACRVDIIAANTKAGASMATATASDSDSSQAAHESQAGMTIPIRSGCGTVAAQQGGTYGEDDFGRSRGVASAQVGLSARCDAGSKQQPQMSSPNLGLDVLAAAASAVGAVPIGRAVRGRGQPVARTSGGQFVSGRTPSAPDQVAAAAVTPGRKRKALKAADPAYSPSKKQKPVAPAVTSTPSRSTPRKGKPGRPKTPGKAGNRPASTASPVRNGARQRQEGSDKSPQADSSSVEDVPQQTLRSPGTGKDRTNSRTYKTPSTSGRRVAATSSNGTPQLRDRAGVAEKSAKPWWVV